MWNGEVMAWFKVLSMDLRETKKNHEYFRRHINSRNYAVLNRRLCGYGGMWLQVETARPRTQHDCHHNTKVKPEAATAVIELLMMGGKTPQTCWAVNKRQDNKLKNCCNRLVIYLNCTMMHGLTNLKFYIWILGHLVCKMWIIQEPKKVTLWNKRHFEEKNEECAASWDLVGRAS